MQTQKTFDYPRGSRLRAIDLLKLPPDVTVSRRGLLLRIKSLLRAIDSFAGKDSVCWATRKHIAEQMGYSERSCQRDLAVATKLGLVTTDQRGPHLTPITTINWSLVFDWSSEFAHESAATSEIRGDSGVTPGVTSMASRGDSEGKTGVTVASPNPTVNRQEPKEEPFSLRDSLDTHLENTQDFYQCFGSTEAVTTNSMTLETTVKTSWMTPYADIWLETFGGLMACKQASKPLRTLEQAHGADETLRRWRNYCEAHRGRGAFANASKFSQTFGEWDQLPVAERKHQRIDSAVRGNRLLQPGEKQEVYDPAKHGAWNPITGLG